MIAYNIHFSASSIKKKKKYNNCKILILLYINENFELENDENICLASIIDSSRCKTNIVGHYL